MKLKLNFAIFMLAFNTMIAQTSIWKIGDRVPNIVSNTVDGNPFDLSQQKSKVILLDFWATWCAPCLEEQPELKKIHADYKSKVTYHDFEIIGFSMDKNKESWQKAIARFQITWPQVGDLKMWRSPIVGEFKITELPFNLILDENKKVIAVNLHGKDLEQFLSQYFAKNTQ